MELSLSKSDVAEELAVLDKLIFSNLKKLKPKKEEKDPDEYEELVYCWCAGGCFTSIFRNKKINDIDVFFRCEEDFLKAKELLLATGTHKFGFENDFVCNIYHDKMKIQLVKKHYHPTPQECIDTFDFTVVKFAYDANFIFYNKRFFKDLAKNRIVVDDKLIKPLNSIKRAFKYTQRGFQLCPKGMARLIKECNELTVDWNSPDQNIIEFYPDGTATFLGID
jgi:hypothetical protein